MPATAATRPVKFCKVPADSREPVEELTFDEVPGDIGGFTKHINGLYARLGAKVDVEVLRQHVTAHAAKNGSAPADVSSDMLDQLAQSQTVDIVPLMPAVPGNGWLGVNMYVDDKGIPKNLEVNRRASEISSECGIPTDVRGDAYISRLCDDQEDIFERKDLTMREMSADAPWVKEARKYNEERASRGPSKIPESWKGTGQGGAAAQPADALECLSAATDHRAKGTASFKRGDFASAETHYALAAAELSKLLSQPAHKAEADEQRLLIHLNLASACLHLQKPYDAIKACDVALEIDPKSVKAWFRRGQACAQIQQYAAARRNLHRAAELEPQNREIRAALDACVLAYHKHAEAAAAAARDDAPAPMSDAESPGGAA